MTQVTAGQDKCGPTGSVAKDIHVFKSLPGWSKHASNFQYYTPDVDVLLGHRRTCPAVIKSMYILRSSDQVI